jgi:hypothetical protein
LYQPTSLELASASMCVGTTQAGFQDQYQKLEELCRRAFCGWNEHVGDLREERCGDDRWCDVRQPLRGNSGSIYRIRRGQTHPKRHEPTAQLAYQVRCRMHVATPGAIAAWCDMASGKRWKLLHVPAPGHGKVPNPITARASDPQDRGPILCCG